jgi:hypothetical protein
MKCRNEILLSLFTDELAKNPVSDIQGKLASLWRKSSRSCITKMSTSPKGIQRYSVDAEALTHAFLFKFHWHCACGYTRDCDKNCLSFIGTVHVCTLEIVIKIASTSLLFGLMYRKRSLILMSEKLLCSLGFEI